MYAARLILALIVSAILAGCLRPPLTEDRVRNDFLQLHPKLEIVRVEQIEIEQGDAKFMVYYRNPGEPTLRRKLMHYRDPSNEDRWAISGSNDGL